MRSVFNFSVSTGIKIAPPMLRSLSSRDICGGLLALTAFAGSHASRLTTVGGASTNSPPNPHYLWELSGWNDLVRLSFCRPNPPPFGGGVPAPCVCAVQAIHTVVLVLYSGWCSVSIAQPRRPLYWAEGQKNVTAKPFKTFSALVT